MTKTSHVPLSRRGFDLGLIDLQQTPAQKPCDPEHNHARWRSGRAIHLGGACEAGLPNHQRDLRATEQLYIAILEEQECAELLSQPPYAIRLAPKFESLGSAINAGDDQEIETVLFDAVAQEQLLAEDLWMKVSWLSFYEEDASLRFRFSFGLDHEEDVAADLGRQQYAAELTDAIFPESQIITQNQELTSYLKELLKSDTVRFVERIVYFNSPNGGAYLHHDRERGHAGVVYAQLSGATFWLALPQSSLVSEIADFIKDCDSHDLWPTSVTESMQAELLSLNTEPNAIAEQLDTFANSSLIHLINETKEFVQQLVHNGYGYAVNEGDVLLLPQEAAKNCCWHSVFNLTQESGQALSFAIRAS